MSKLYLQESAWVTGCDYLPGLRRVAACTERSITVWDNRAKGKNQVSQARIIVTGYWVHNNKILKALSGNVMKIA